MRAVEQPAELPQRIEVTLFRDHHPSLTARLLGGLLMASVARVKLERKLDELLDAELHLIRERRTARMN